MPVSRSPAFLHHPSTARAYRCVCGAQVFFRNSACLQCGRALGFDPWLGQVLAIEPEAETGLWHAADPGATGEARRYRRCAQSDSPSLCNWLVVDLPELGPAQAPCSCAACRLNRTIPDLRLSQNHEPWRKVELARRRLVSQLIGLGLPVEPRSPDGSNGGLTFDTLASMQGQPLVMTGHLMGVVTLNLVEADDAYRERIRTSMNEPYRTLLGHYRHEVGHYYWDRLVRFDRSLWDFRALFGDERQDYGAALQRHYQGVQFDWRQSHITSYACSHPWEDWAETWAHYLHMRDTLDTAVSFGLSPDRFDVDAAQYDTAVLQGAAAAVDPEGFLTMLNAWTRLTGVLNELSRSMGLQDFYPFELSQTVVRKLHFVHARVAPFERVG
ncbi:putative zinc-binding metallopeptidase [Hydrogenophaga sp. RWCD_12]|uniref:zinc-binding metallopeptidase family protein n=1 Tax=Hydrogenophaga sp. RWCD_12 TaxID=3391190 RepID=UPI0039854F07